MTASDLARSFLDFTPLPGRSPDGQLAELVEDGLREYRLAARWLLGERDLGVALPVERLWAGIPNCSGQMMFPPLAAVYAGHPAEAYQATFALDFIDAPLARDLASALVAGLAAALDPQLDAAPVSQRWSVLLSTLRDIDPYRQAEVPFAGRPLHRWLDQVDAWVAEADGRPAHLFYLLETAGRPVYWWDAHFTLVVPLAILKLCQFDPLAALHLTLDFGHDTDSYAQVLGCLVGAVHGAELFPNDMREAVVRQLQEDFDESIEDWTRLLKQFAQRHGSGQSIVRFLQHDPPSDP